MTSFDQGGQPGPARAGLLRDVVRQEVVRRQLGVHLPLAPARALHVGAGQGAQVLHLAREGFDVTAVEPDERVRTAMQATLDAEPEAVRARVRVVDGSLQTLDTLPQIDGETFDAVLCHEVLTYVDDPNQPMRALGRRVAVDGVVSLVVRNDGALAWRHVLRGDHAAAHAGLDEADRAGWERRDARCTDELGVACRADNLDRLGAYLGGIRCALEYWYGVGTFTDAVDPGTPVPADPAELERRIALEERLGRTEPYRRTGTLLHLVARRGEGRGPQL